MSLFPMFLKLTARPVVVVGAGTIAESKIESLLEAEAQVTVVAPKALPRVRAWVDALAARPSVKEWMSQASELPPVFHEEYAG